MKTCPTCGNSYSDELSYCLQDGTVLRGSTTSELADRPTEVYRPEPGGITDLSRVETIVSNEQQIAPPTQGSAKQFHFSAVEPATRMGCALTIGQVATGLIVVIGLGLVGFYYSFRQPELASVDPKYSNNVSTNAAGNPTTTANVAMNASTTPPHASATRTPALSDNSVASPKSPPPKPKPVSKTVPGGLLNGKAISLPEPKYPPIARAARASGVVMVQVLVNEDGSVVSASAVSGHPLLRESAAQAARAARFAPTLRDGQPVKVSGVIQYRFVP